MSKVDSWVRRHQRQTAVAVVAGAIGVVAVAAGVIGQAQQKDDEREVRELVRALADERAPREVTYYVEGTVKYADMTMETPTGTSQQSADVPMTRKSDGRQGISFEFGRGAFVYISAQNPGDSGYVTCRIEIDGVTVSENTSTSDYGIATCKGTA